MSYSIQINNKTTKSLQNVVKVSKNTKLNSKYIEQIFQKEIYT